MQELLKRLITDLHTAYFKPNGFKKERQRFRREVDQVIHEVEFQSSLWNSSGESIRFYINILVGFADIPMTDGKLAFTGKGRIDKLVSGVPEQFELTRVTYEMTQNELLRIIPKALAELPNHYEDVRARAKAGMHTPIPLPETWRT